ncbi:hypothetical protein F5Y18DRAFT_423967 [Xylariaceae sp. FL1019]|nr:hypothetical protein F5Y18DRAFT_423967 [Xylariaceae sp. FL1019]
MALADVRVEAEVVQMMRTTVESLWQNAGAVLVNVLLDISPDEGDRIQSVKVREVFLSYKHAGGNGNELHDMVHIGVEQAKHFIAQGKGGKIIWTLFDFRLQAAPELGKHNIIVNAKAFTEGPIYTQQEPRKKAEAAEAAEAEAKAEAEA